MLKLPHDTQRRIQYLLKIAEPRRIVAHAAPHDLMRFFYAVGMGNLTHAGCRAGGLLVSQEVMAQTIQHCLGRAADIGP